MFTGGLVSKMEIRPLPFPRFILVGGVSHRWPRVLGEADWGEADWGEADWGEADWGD